MDIFNRKRRFGAALGAVLVLAFFLYVPALFLKHHENDEVIYQTLAARTSEGLGHYNVLGTDFARDLPEIYGSRLFLHPPGFVVSLLPFRHFLGNSFLLLLPIVSGVMVIFLAALLARRLFSPVHGLVSAGILVLCPILSFSSTRVLMESYLTALLLAAVVLLLRYDDRRRWQDLLWAAIFLSAASLTKVSAFFILPVFVYVFGTMKATPVQRYLAGGFFLMLVAAMNLPWYLFFKAHQGAWMFMPVITERSKELFPFIKEVTGRSPWLYLMILPGIYPVYAFSFLKMLSFPRERSALILIGWVMCMLAGYFWGARSGIIGVEARYLTPVIPALAILAADFVLERREKRGIVFLGVLFLGVGIAGVILNSFVFRPSDILDVFRFVKALTGLYHPG